MTRLPIPGSDNNTWGDILNEFLLQSHNADGTIKETAVTRIPASAIPTNSVSLLNLQTTNEPVSGQVLSTTGSGLFWDTPVNAPVVSVVGQTGAVTGAQIAADSAVKGAFGPAMIQPTGVAATDTAAIQAAHDNLPSSGGDIRLAPGVFTVTQGGVNFTKSNVRLCGSGSGGSPTSTAGGYTDAGGITTIQCDSTTGNAIASSGNACIFQDFHIVNTHVADPTSGAGIAITGGGASNRYINVTVNGFYNCIDVANGFEWFMTGCILYNFKRAGLRIASPTLPDAGDMGVVNNQFIAGPTRTAPLAGVEWVSGGGLRFVGNKVNKRGTITQTIGLFFHPADGIATSVFTISGNSFENCSYGIFSDDTGNTGTGRISKIAILGNEFLNSIKAIYFNRTSTDKLKVVTIVGNSFATGISLHNTDRVRIASNIYEPTVSTTLSIVNGGVTNLYLADFSFTTAARPAASIMDVGSTYYDTTISKPVFSNGTSWLDAAGNVV